jgi:hypothetical protein
VSIPGAHLVPAHFAQDGCGEAIVWGGNSGAYLNDGGQWRTVSLYPKN